MKYRRVFTLVIISYPSLSKPLRFARLESNRNAALVACKLVLIYHDYCFTTIRKLSSLSQLIERES